MYNLIGNKLYQLSISAPYNNVIHINMKMTASYIYNKCIHNIFDKHAEVVGKKGGNGSESKCMIASREQGIISYQPNLLVRCIYLS